MSVEERRRIQLFERWSETWSQEDAETMLELLPPPGRDPATSDHIAALDLKIDTRYAELDAKIDRRCNELDAKIDRRYAELDTKIDHVHAELDAKIDATREHLELKIDASAAELVGVFRAEINRAIVTQTRITVFSMVTAFAAVSALALGLG